MKKLLFLAFVLVFGYQLSKAQEYTEESSESGVVVHPTVNLLIGNPVQDFWETYSKQRLWGFDIGVVFPLNKSPWFQPGVLFEVYPFGTDKATYKGIEVKTSGAFIKGNMVGRFRFLNEQNISPFIELGYGFNLSSTSTTYEIVDEATFFEEFFLDEEDVSETVTVKDHTHGAHNFNAGAGIVFNRLITFQVKYNLTSVMRYVERDDVKVTDNSVTYRISESPMQMIVVSVGFSLERAFSD